RTQAGLYGFIIKLGRGGDNAMFGHVVIMTERRRDDEGRHLEPVQDQPLAGAPTYPPPAANAS
ncbi:hypothetical protein RF55_23746, partial [Lasius niger]